MTIDIPALRDAYKRRYPEYHRLVEVALPILQSAISAGMRDAAVDGRPKEPYKFVQKAIRKYLEDPEEYRDPLQRIRDAAGLRVVTAHLDDAARASDIAMAVFDITEFEDVRERYKPNELGYLGLHLQGRLKSDAVAPSDTGLLELDFELQIHTRAQNAWSTVSHPLLYKPPPGTEATTVAAKVYRAVALVSLFDEQVALARAEMLEHPSYRPAALLDFLSRQFLDWLIHPSDDGLSLRVLTAIQPSYGDADLARIEALIDGFVRTNRDKLASLLTLYGDSPEEYPLLFQPEVLAIAERLESAPALLAAAWRDSGLPADLLSDTATALGRPIDG